MARVRVTTSKKPKTIEVDKVKNVFIRAIDAHRPMEQTQYDLGFQAGLELAYYLLKAAAGEIKEE